MAALRQRLDTARTEIETALTEAAKAAETIIGRAEELLALGKGPAVEHAALNILEACSFQDLTGQRLKKALHSLERIVVEIRRKELGLGHLKDEPELAKWREQNLLHGPAAEGEALGQAAIDDIFASSSRATK
jgi:chemotaxis protein CheZ